jgi:hypothetical protein
LSCTGSFTSAQPGSMPSAASSWRPTGSAGRHWAAGDGEHAGASRPRAAARLRTPIAAAILPELRRWSSKHANRSSRQVKLAAPVGNGCPSRARAHPRSITRTATATTAPQLHAAQVQHRQSPLRAHNGWPPPSRSTLDPTSSEGSGSRWAATAARRVRYGRRRIVGDDASDEPPAAASTCGFPMILHARSRSRIRAKWPVAEFTRQRSQVRYLSRPPAQTPSLLPPAMPAVSRLSARRHHASKLCSWSAARG